jgi:hypothetical protein
MVRMVLTGWVDRRGWETVAYLIEENRLLRRQLGRRLRLTDKNLPSGRVAAIHGSVRCSISISESCDRQVGRCMEHAAAHAPSSDLSSSAASGLTVGRALVPLLQPWRRCFTIDSHHPNRPRGRVSDIRLRGPGGH